MATKIAIFRGKNIRKVIYRNEWWFSEIDIVLEKGSELIGVEIKYKRKAVNKAFKNRYSEARVRLVTADNFY